MRSLFVLNGYSADEQTTIKRLFVRVACCYAAVALLIVATVSTEIVPSVLAKLFTGSQAVAAERSGPLQCAARDIKMVLLIEDLGETRRVSYDRLADAFSTMLEARDLCSKGRTDDALAIYDNIHEGIATASVQTAAK